MAHTETDIAPPNRLRYTLDGDATVEARIARDQSLIADAVQSLVAPPTFVALVLMGGYGRGEGGYCLRHGQPEPYNDYDYFVAVRQTGRSQRRTLQQALAQRAKTLEHEVGVEVDFALLRQERLPKAEYSLMNAEMLWGHRVVAGNPHVLDAMPSMPFARLPRGELTRLLLNRGALLLMNRQRLADGSVLGPERQEVFFKYLFKAVLACGDARLAGTGAYHPSYAQKLERLQRMDWSGKASFMELYTQAWEQKFHPDYGRYAAEDAARWQERVVRLWLETLAWFEQQRLGRAFGDWDAYALPSVPKGQGQSRWRNAAIAVRDFGLAELPRRPRWCLRYPRERLIAALPLLLSRPDRPASPILADALALPEGASWTQATESFLRLWRRFA